MLPSKMSLVANLIACLMVFKIYSPTEQGLWARQAPGMSLSTRATPMAAGGTKQLETAISVDSLFTHLTILGHDSLEGRGTGSRGAKKAARYIREQLQRFGLHPAAGSGRFIQTVPLHGSIPLVDSKLVITVADTVLDLRLWEDYILYNSGAQTLIPTALSLVFVGYGIFAPEFDYNDYRNLDVENRIVVFLAGEPPSEDPAYFEGKETSVYADPVLKQRVALSRGARGSIMLPLPRDDSSTYWDYWVKQFAFEDVKLPYTLSENLNIFLNFDLADELFRGAPLSLGEILDIEAAGAIRSFPLKAMASFTGSFQERDFIGENIAGVVEGSDPLLRDSYVLVCAHYDHLGIGGAVGNDSIYNGVVDNAIGVSATLEIARVLSRLTTKPRRSVLFLFVTGEEKGLLGSRFYCEQPLVPLSRTIAAINVDGIAILDRFKSISGVGANLSTLEQALGRVADNAGLKVVEPPSMLTQRDPSISSDHFSFAQAGIPAVLLMEGLEYESLSAREGLTRFLQWGQEIYHTPFDDLQQPLNIEPIRQHTSLILSFVTEVANTFIEPQWLPGTRFINARLRSLTDEL